MAPNLTGLLGHCYDFFPFVSLLCVGIRLDMALLGVDHRRSQSAGVIAPFGTNAGYARPVRTMRFRIVDYRNDERPRWPAELHTAAPTMARSSHLACSVIIPPARNNARCHLLVCLLARIAEYVEISKRLDDFALALRVHAGSGRPAG
jgi:hypothetical protein